ncbi:hypothetical protein TNCV_1942531 [Trichonephila clavipes]|nr:hypothetical protein TNCV_1942531 [Trichonephila clavipes]
MNDVAPVLTSSEMRNIMKSTRNYLEAPSNGKKNYKMDEFHSCLVFGIKARSNVCDGVKQLPGSCQIRQEEIQES